MEVYRIRKDPLLRTLHFKNMASLKKALARYPHKAHVYIGSEIVEPDVYTPSQALDVLEGYDEDVCDESMCTISFLTKSDIVKHFVSIEDAADPWPVKVSYEGRTRAFEDAYQLWLWAIAGRALQRHEGIEASSRGGKRLHLSQFGDRLLVMTRPPEERKTGRIA